MQWVDTEWSGQKLLPTEEQRKFSMEGWIHATLLPGQRWDELVTVKFMLQEAMKAQRGSRGIALPFFLTWTLDGVGAQHHAPAVLPPGKSRYPLYMRLGGPQGRSARVQKISPPPPGLDPWTVQPVASRYTDWAIPAPRMNMTHDNLRKREEWQVTASGWASEEADRQILRKNMGRGCRYGWYSGM